ncbi:Zn(II)2Cys6 transcription factor [Aspergillus affinis]|uniref:Zn(II)2Cys6 transcription factor n=1 Tax=Aspergillus affinis TaxID=1070780 RepID=UPI0022FE485D|nr:putative Zn(II)2Cys6 transcription factor [Aspergillus affinis]KAI9040583.1 putative Zn(II)2Cys6 transcription factor [Aspergillus affinis]
MDEDERPTKRIKRACETCRRKKSRCSGERPVCSNCTRLGHHCEYAAEEAPEYVRSLPLPLFHIATFLQSYDSRDAEVQLAIQALGQRFNDRGVADPEVNRQVQDWTESSRRMVMSRLAEGAVELSTLQAMCLLTMIDYTNSNIIRAGVNLRLAKYLVECLKLDLPDFPDNLEDERDERVLCRWTIYMLEALVGDTSLTANSNLVNATTRTDPGLAAYTVQFSKVWELSRAYASAHIKSESPPPWSAQSDYSVINSELMGCESRTPLKYRMHASRFPELLGTELNQRREYWGPWLFFQFVCHSTLVLVNHPLLLSIRLKNFRQTMPQSFLRNSFEQITLNTSWILHFVTLLEKKDFEVSDPTLGQCVAIVATIFLQHSFVEEPSFRQKAQIGYDKCLGFVSKMGRHWPHLERQANKLHQLRNSISSSGTHGSQQAWSVNVHLLWEILVSSPTNKLAEDFSKDIFGPYLTNSIVQSSSQSDDALSGPELALIGSAGITGHRTVAKELVTYPPEDLPQPDQGQDLVLDLNLSGLVGNPELGFSATPGGGLLQPQDYGHLLQQCSNVYRNFSRNRIVPDVNPFFSFFALLRHFAEFDNTAAVAKIKRGKKPTQEDMFNIKRVDIAEDEPVREIFVPFDDAQLTLVHRSIGKYRRYHYYAHYP